MGTDISVIHSIVGSAASPPCYRRMSVPCHLSPVELVDLALFHRATLSHPPACSTQRDNQVRDSQSDIGLRTLLRIDPDILQAPGGVEQNLQPLDLRIHKCPSRTKGNRDLRRVDRQAILLKGDEVTLSHLRIELSGWLDSPTWSRAGVAVEQSAEIEVQRFVVEQS